MSPYARVAAVTGANKGIGYAIVRNLALQYPSSPLNAGPLLIYLTARDASRGRAALDALQADEQLLQAKVLAAQGGPVTLAFKALDISAPDSIEAFAAELRAEHGQVDVVVNNAGIAMEGFNADVATKTLATNYHGTLHATLSLLPLLRPAPSSRLVNVASMAGALTKYSPALQDRFRAAAQHKGETPAAAATAATALMQAFEDGVRAGGGSDASHEALGFPSAAYAVSKAGVIAATRAVALCVKEQAKGDDAYPLVNSCCPGWVDTDMTKHRGTKTVDQGAETPVMLALSGDLGGRVGEFWMDGKVAAW